MKITKFPSIKIAPLILLALKDLLKPKVILVVCLPIFASIFVWIFVTYLAWDDLQNWSVQFIQLGWLDLFKQWFPNIENTSTGVFTFIFRFLFIFIFIIPLTIITATVLTSIFLVPILVSELRKTDFPTLIKKSSSIFSGIGTTLSYAMKYFFAWVGSLPFWFIPFGAVIIPYVLLSWFNSRVLTYEVLTEVATPDEIKIFILNHSRTLFIIGLSTSFLYSIPLINFIAPLITSSIFSRYCITQFHRNLTLEPT